VRTIRIVILALLLLWIVSRSGKFLIIDEPQKADVILVPAGETDRRPARALALLTQGYAPRLVLDVPADAKVYDSTYLQIAEHWASEQPQSQSISVCPIQGLSTKSESTEAAACLRKLGAHSVLLVTSEFHTRRALSVFRKQQPDFAFQVAAAYDPTQFGERWWRHRQWAKTNLDEWLRLLWWECVDRWY
jgi:hypothetical protein